MQDEGYANIQLSLHSILWRAMSISQKTHSLKHRVSVRKWTNWNDVLNRFNGVTKTVQKQDVNLVVIVSLIQSLNYRVTARSLFFNTNRRPKLLLKIRNIPIAVVELLNAAFE